MTTTEKNLQYAITSVANPDYLVLPRDFSRINQRGYSSTDKQGNLLTYVCDFEFISTGTNNVHVYTMPETWRAKAAFKKWHALREFMFRSSGIKKSERGRYAKQIRPYFDPIHSAFPARTLDPLAPSYTLSGDASTWDYVDPGQEGIGSGDWTYSNIVVETNPDSPDTNDETDMFNLHMCGESVNTLSGTVSTDQNWTSVGMISSFNADRAMPTAEPDDPVDFRNNPLALLKGRSESTYETAVIADMEAQDGPPYDVGLGINPTLGGYLETTSTGQQITRAYGVRIPAGLALIEATATCEFRCVVRRIEMA